MPLGFAQRRAHRRFRFALAARLLRLLRSADGVNRDALPLDRRRHAPHVWVAVGPHDRHVGFAHQGRIAPLDGIDREADHPAGEEQFGTVVPALTPAPRSVTIGSCPRRRRPNSLGCGAPSGKRNSQCQARRLKRRRAPLSSDEPECRACGDQRIYSVVGRVSATPSNRRQTMGDDISSLTRRDFLKLTAKTAVVSSGLLAGCAATSTTSRATT